MALLIDGEKRLEATEQNITNAVKDLNDAAFEFIIFENPASPHSFMQAAGNNDDFELQYRDGESDSDQYYVPGDVTSDDVIKAFLSYKKGDEQYKQLFTWKPLWDSQNNEDINEISDSERRKSKGCLALLLVIGAVTTSLFLMC